MAKDSYWFKHDSTAGRGLRMRKMAHIHGHWGKGIYWDVIEILRDQANYCFDYDDSSLQMLADLIGCKDDTKFITWMRDCIQLDLLQVSKGKFFSSILCENMGKWETKKRNGSETKGETEAKRKHKIREEDIIEEKIIVDNKIEKLVFPFSSLDFKNIWDVLIKEKKWRKKSFTALQASLHQLSSVSEQDAIQMIKNTIAGEWQGLFELKNNKNGKQQITANSVADELKKYSTTHK